MWWSIAATRGNRSAPYSREQIENEMTPDEVKKARRMAIDCEARGYRDC
jgi:hypothetical protein